MARIEPARRQPLIRLAVGAACLGWFGSGDAAETCLANSIDEVGRCLKSSPRVQRAVDAQLHGNRPAPPPAPPIDPAFVATPVHGGLAIGDFHRINAGSKEDWVLTTQGAEVDSEGRLRSTGRRSGDDKLVWLTVSRPANGITRPVVALRALALKDQLLPAEFEKEDSAFPACIEPEASMNNPYEQLTGAFRWMQLSPKWRVLVAGVSHHEGYAGGGGSFEGEVLLLPENGTLRPIACYAVSNYQMFGGDWNPDGTRQHPESHAAWTVFAQKGKEWPDLHLRPATRDTSAAVLTWDGARRQYVLARRTESKGTGD